MAPRTVVLDGSPIPAALVGGKGHALNRLIEIGMPVPPSGALTTEAYLWFVAESGLDSFLGELGKEGLPAPERRDIASARIDEAFLRAPMPQALEQEILELGARVRGDGELAVRSSATAEDLATASFAGQYRSFLEVADDEALLRSVRLVWASLWLPAPRAYRVHAGVDEASLAMSVVLMRLVPATRAGVAFTVDPAGDGTTLRVEAVEGLAESLVSGEVTPDAFVLPRAGDLRRPIDSVIDGAVELALGIERAFGVPQDVEWAHDGRQTFVVQARPITTLPVGDRTDGFDTPIGDDDVYSTAGVAEMLPGVLPPLLWTTVSGLLEEGFRRLFDRMRALPEVADEVPFLARIHGRAVLSLDLLEAAARLVPGGSAQEIERQYFGRVINEEDIPTGQEAITRPGAVRSLLTSVREVRARQTFRSDAEVGIATIRRLVLDPPHCHFMSSGELLAYRHRVLDLAGRVFGAEVAVAAAAASAFRGVELFLEQHLGAEAGPLAQRLTAGGIDPCGANLAFDSCRLAAVALADETLAERLTRHASADVRALLEGSPAGGRLYEEVAAELARAGSAALFAGPTWAESEDLAWRLVAQAVETELRGRPRMLTAEERLGLQREVEGRFTSTWRYRLQRIMTGQVIDVRRRMLRRLVRDTVEFLELREKTKSAVLLLGGEVRRIHLALGHRLHGEGALDAPLDVDYLSSGELALAARGLGPSRWEIARRRRAVAGLQESEALPAVFAGDPSRSRIAAPAGGDEFSGWAASPGVYEGTARVVTSATEPIAPGEVLVARTTDPSWTPLFLTAGAIVVEEGGPLSHAAIVARELRLPAVLNVPGLLARLAGIPGARVRVDGGAGTVSVVGSILEAEKAREEVGL